jgi:hypothetical protein
VVDRLGANSARTKPRNPRQNAPRTDRRSREPKRTQAGALIEIALEACQLFHAPDGTAYADITMDGHRETWPIASRGFRSWVRHAAYRATSSAPNGETMKTALGVIEAQAIYAEAERPVALRVTPHEQRIYLDLADPKWRSVEIDANGWRIVSEPPVRFRRPRGMLALPEPQRGGSLDEFRRFLPARDDAFVLAISWLLAALHGRGPYPILALAGEQGAGKSTAAMMLRRLVDPHAAPLRTLPRDNRDLFIGAHNGAIIALDNLSAIPAEVSDSLCRLATGGGFATRTLHTDSDETIFAGKRPIVLTSIDDVATRSDLADRALLVALDPIPEARRVPERELWHAFDAATPRILGALLDIVAHGLRKLPTTRLERLPRMADYALWLAACETAVWPAGTHMAAYTANRRDGVDLVLDADPVAQALRAHMQDRAELTTTATDLMRSLDQLVAEHVRRHQSWPANGRALTGRLKRLAPALRAVGLTWDRHRQADTGRRLWTFRFNTTTTNNARS